MTPTACVSPLPQVLGRVKVGRGVTLLPTSIVSHGTVVPDNYLLTPGTTSQRLPPGPAGGCLDIHTQNVNNSMNVVCALFSL